MILFAGFVFTLKDMFEQHVVEAGDRAPGFAITTESGQKITNKDFGGKLLVLNFWATWCPPCVEEMPSLNRVRPRYGPSGMVVLGVSIDKNEAAYKVLSSETVSRSRRPATRKRTSAATMARSSGPRLTSLDRNGKVVQKYIGPRDWTDPQM